MIELMSQNDKILDLLNISKKDRSSLCSLSTQKAKVIFPVCGKRCFSNIQKYRIKDTAEINSNPGVLNWDNDRTEDKKSSIDILIDWLTTEENAAKIFWWH
jgi:hypothetical protein